MSINIFRFNLVQIQNFAIKLNKECISIPEKKVLMKTYASDLHLNLTDNMIKEVLGNLG